MKSERKINGTAFYAFTFGLFLGLCIWKFGNPVILDSKIPTPVTPADFLNDPWPTRWAGWIFLPLALAGALLALAQKKRWGQTPGEPQKSKGGIGWRGRSPHQKWLWLLPLLWFGWQLLSATQT